MISDYLVLIGLALVMGMTLVLPFSVKRVEEDLEAFLFVMGLSAVSISGLWSMHLIGEAFREPIPITITVAVVGLIFRQVRSRLRHLVHALTGKIGVTATIFVIVAALGLGSSFLTAIVSAIILAEVISLLKFNRSYEIRLTVLACYAIGLGAALTPLGEPLSTIVVAKLKAPPHNADFFYLLREVGEWIIPGVLLCAALAARGAKAAYSSTGGLQEDAHDSVKVVLTRAAKVYIFVMALIFLGAGLTPLAERYMVSLPTWLLYWVNSVSAILDNATLAAAEITPAMTDRQVTFILMGLLISGGMLIPGNIPNIISSAKLGIKSKEWAKAALPFGAALMTAYFVLLMLLVR
ncbi:MAG: DUF1646 family protein [Elusimicrobia bacterium]|nr:DUF1646 family protein [Elusimicrobiota bacterium]